MIQVYGGNPLDGGYEFIENMREVMKRHMRILSPQGVGFSLLGRETALLGVISAAIHGT